MSFKKLCGWSGCRNLGPTGVRVEGVQSLKTDSHGLELAQDHDWEMMHADAGLAGKTGVRDKASEIRGTRGKGTKRRMRGKLSEDYGKKCRCSLRGAAGLTRKGREPAVIERGARKKWIDSTKLTTRQRRSEATNDAGMWASLFCAAQRRQFSKPEEYCEEFLRVGTSGLGRPRQPPSGIVNNQTCKRQPRDKSTAHKTFGSHLHSPIGQFQGQICEPRRTQQKTQINGELSQAEITEHRYILAWPAPNARQEEPSAKETGHRFVEGRTDNRDQRGIHMDFLLAETRSETERRSPKAKLEVFHLHKLNNIRGRTIWSAGQKTEPYACSRHSDSVVRVGNGDRINYSKGNLHCDREVKKSRSAPQRALAAGIKIHVKKELAGYQSAYTTLYQKCAAHLEVHMGKDIH
ncbi:hypothetical protein DFH09DRAFT_1085549 [Mycena vulgaris]|nr:hypothetical protein DFH09DRAFT_1085549 [Mycena vulgaris]